MNHYDNNFQSIHDVLKKKRITGKIYQKFFLHPKLLKCLEGAILDVGAGLGDFIMHCPNSYAVDPDPLNVKEMLKKNIRAELLLNDKINHENVFFDSVIMDNVLEHISDPINLLLEIKRVLKPNGIFLIGVPGKKGFDTAPDHKIFYDEYLLKELLSKDYIFIRSFYTPFKSNLLNKYLKSYCLYVIFRKKL
jgi:SAM-dependent methyltransferase